MKDEDWHTMRRLRHSRHLCSVAGGNVICAISKIGRKNARAEWNATIIIHKHFLKY
jgi:hypothetical protein